MQLSELMAGLIVIWVVAKVLGQLAERVGQPAVLGELLGGVLVGPHVLGWLPQHEFIHLLGQIGVILLLFEIGLETDLSKLLRAGPCALTVGMIGMILSMAGGLLAGRALGLSLEATLLLGAALMATSIAISTRTLADLGELRSVEGRVILGAAVLDDVVGLVILGVITQFVRTGAVTVSFALLALLKAVAFLGGAVGVGTWLARPLLRLVDRMTVRGALVTAALAFALALALLAQQLGSAAIIGAFAAGLVLARTHRKQLIEERLRPIANIFVPVFFVTIGGSWTRGC